MKRFTVFALLAVAFALITATGCNSIDVKRDTPNVSPINTVVVDLQAYVRNSVVETEERWEIQLPTVIVNDEDNFVLTIDDFGNVLTFEFPPTSPSFNFLKEPPIGDNEPITYGPFFYLFEEVKRDTHELLYSLIGIDMSLELAELLLYPADIIGFYYGGTAIFVSLHLEYHLMRVTMMHEIFHYLMARRNLGVEGSLFNNVNWELKNRFIEEGLVTLLSEFVYGPYEGRTWYHEEVQFAQILLLIYGEDFLLDAFAGRPSVIKADMIRILGSELYYAFVAAMEYCTQSWHSLILYYRLTLQEFIFEKGYLYLVLVN